MSGCGFRRARPPGATPPAPIPPGEELLERKATNLTAAEGRRFSLQTIALGYVAEAHLLRQIVLDWLEVQERHTAPGVRRNRTKGR